MDYTIKDINTARKELIDEKQKVLNALNSSEIQVGKSGSIHRHLTEAVHKFYEPKLEKLDIQFEVAEWWLTREVK